MMYTPALNDRVRPQPPNEKCDNDRAEDLIEAMKKSKYGLQRCSKEFLSAFSSSLHGTVRVNAGDCLLNQGKKYAKQVFLVETGTMEILVDGKQVRTLRRGDVLGKHTLVKASVLQRPGSESKFDSWLMAQDVSGVTVRAISNATLSCGGILGLYEVKEMKRDFVEDFLRLEHELTSCLSRSKKQQQKR